MNNNSMEQYDVEQFYDDIVNEINSCENLLNVYGRYGKDINDNFYMVLINPFQCIIHGNGIVLRNASGDFEFNLSKNGYKVFVVDEKDLFKKTYYLFFNNEEEYSLIIDII